MFMGPFAFVSWWPLSQRATHYRCGLMNDVAQTLCWHPCVLGRRDAAALASSGQLRMRTGGTWGNWTEDLSVILRQDAHNPPLSPPSSLPSLSSQWKYGTGQLAMAMMLSLILRWWIAPLPFTWIYIYILTDTVKDPRSPPEATEGTPKGLCGGDECCCAWFYLSNRNVSACFDVLFNTFVAHSELE